MCTTVHLDSWRILSTQTIVALFPSLRQKVSLLCDDITPLCCPTQPTLKSPTAMRSLLLLRFSRPGLFLVYLTVCRSLAVAELQSVIEPLELSPSATFDSLSTACTKQNGIRATVSADVLPHSGLPWTIQLFVQDLSREGHLLHAGGLSVVHERDRVVISADGMLQPLYMPLSADHEEALLTMSYHGDRQYLFCSSSEQVFWTAPRSLLPYHISLATGIVLGDPRGESTAPALYQSLKVSPLPLPLCNESLASWSTPGATAPEILFPGRPEASDMFVDQQLAIDSTVQCGDTICKLRVTAFGAYPSSCNKPECGHLYEEAQGKRTVSVSMKIEYSRAGRYIVRAGVTMLEGTVSYRDHVVMVRKLGDDTKKTPCCRNSAGIIAGQEGRPVHYQSIEDSTTEAFKQSLGWGSDYVKSDSEAEVERLFNFGMLAPPPSDSPVQVFSCWDSRMAGAGSPRVSVGEHPELVGHGKRVFVTNMGYDSVDFPLRNQASELLCQTHWTRWQFASENRFTAPAYGWNFVYQGQTCSMACTNAASDAHVRWTGVYDRAMEATIEHSFGRLSVSPDIVIDQSAPYLLKSTSDDPFQFHHKQSIDHLENTLGVNTDGSDFFMIHVNAPLHLERSPKAHAWFAGLHQPVIFNMHCNPSHYLLMHEGGHRLSFGHAETFVTRLGFQSSADPLTDGFVSSELPHGARTYTDETDAMACCYGDYSIFAKLKAGYVQGLRERTVIDRGQLRFQQRQTISLCPYDRPECRGEMMAVSIAMPSGATVVLGYRSMPFWPDIKVAWHKTVPHRMRGNLSGLSIVIVLNQGGRMSDRALLDFNILFRTFPDGLPPTQMDPPRHPEHSHLKPGYVWYHAPERLLLIAHHTHACVQRPGAIPAWSYTAPDFYGFLGEKPFAASFERADYSGFQSLECLNVTIMTQADEPDHLGHDWLQLVSSLGSEVPQVAAFRINVSEDVIAAVWRDNSNATFATGVLEAHLPMRWQLRQTASGAECQLDCWDAVSVKVATLSGRHGLANIRVKHSSVVTGFQASVEYYSYTVGDIQRATRQLSAGPPAAALLWGLSVFGTSENSSSVDLRPGVGSTTVDTTAWPQEASQWTISTKILVPRDAVVVSGGQILSRQVVDGQGGALGYPSVALDTDGSSFHALNITFGVVKHIIPLDRWQNSLFSGVALQVMHSIGRTTVTVDGQSKLQFDDYRCTDLAKPTRHCTGVSLDVALLSGRLVVGLQDSATVTLDHLRVYNYAVPTGDVAAESVCTRYGDCRTFGVADWQPSVPTRAIPDTPFMPPPVQFTVGKWSTCSEACGPGVQIREVQCSRVTETGVIETVTDSWCQAEGASKPAVNRTCELRGCTYARAVVSRGQLVAVSPLGLPAPVVQAGIHLLPKYTAIRQELSLTAARSTAPDAASGNSLGWEQGLPSAWIGGDWGKCTALEAGSPVGEQVRSVQCANIVTGTTRAEAACHPHLKPSTHQACLVGPLCSAADSHDCYEGAACSDNGCLCNEGQTGALCQLPAACGTAQNSRLECCSTAAVSTVTGECCPEGDVLDASGGCCSGSLDACGFCDGGATVVDIQGICCHGVLDGQGLCCQSNDVDECGVCGGNNACATVVVMQGLLRYPDVSWRHVEACPMLASALSLPEAAIACSQLPEAEFEALTADVQISNADVPLESASTSGLRKRSANRLGLQLLQVYNTSVNMRLTIQAVTTGSFRWSFDAVSSDRLQPAALSLVDTEAGNAVVTAVMAIHRNGICGNYRCELGEMEAGCVSDCFGRMNRCPAPGALADVVAGDRSAHCAGKGTCTAATGMCMCWTGYTGKDCSQCAIGFRLSGGNCVLEYIAKDLCVSQWAGVAHCPQTSHSTGTGGRDQLLSFKVIAGVAGTLCALTVAGVAGLLYARHRKRSRCTSLDF
eukprot:jgi/Ulvmu1/1260/UM109_0058.1